MRRPSLARRTALAVLPLEPRGPAPALPGFAYPGFVADRVPNAGLALAGLPLSRRQRSQRSRLERMLGGSTVLHALLLLMLGLVFANQGRPSQPQDQQAVDVVFGSSGTVGNPSPDQGGGGQPAVSQPKADTPPPQQPEVNPTVPPPPPPVPIPDFVPLPPPSVTTEPPVPNPAPRHAEMTRIPLRMARPTTHSSSRSPFANPMDLSFSQAPGPQRSRTGRPGGSGAAIDMSLGPLVKNGHLNTPYATVGIKGVSDDYGAEIDSWIRHHMYYPPDAAQRGEDGASAVHVTIDREGRVKSIRLTGPSGSYALDDATQGIFRGAKLPPVPPDMQGDHFDIDLTINYILVR